MRPTSLFSITTLILCLSALFASPVPAADDDGKLRMWYGPGKGAAVKFAEAFEICEYGRQPKPEEIKALFPFFP